MSTAITSRPSKTIGTAPKTCTLLTACNPQRYKMKRTDYAVSSVTNSGGKYQMTYVGGDITAQTAVGYSVYLEQSGGSPQVFGTVFTTVFSAGNTVITFNEAYIGGAGTGFINVLTARPNFMIETELYDASNVLIFSALNDSPTKYGLISVDVSSVIKSYLDPDNTNTLLGAAYSVDTNFKAFYIKYREVWTGSANAQTSDAANPMVAVLGARQLGSAYAATLAEYTAFATAIGGPVISGKWLTKFTRPKMWLGEYFTLSVALDAAVTGLTAYFKYYDGGGNLLATYSTGGVVTGGIWRVDPQYTYIVSAFAIMPPTIRSIECSFDTGAGVGNNQKIFVDVIDTSAMSNIITLYWRNSLGGDASFSFDFSQEQLYKFQSPTKNKRLTLFGRNLSQVEWDAIQECTTLGEIYQAPLTELLTTTNRIQSRIGQQVYVFPGTSSTATKYGVIVIPTEQMTTSRKRGSTLKLVIELPETITA